MKTFNFKNIKYYLLLLFFTSFSVFSQKYYTDYDEFNGVQDEIYKSTGIPLVNNTGFGGIEPLLKNSKCTESDSNCFYEEIDIFFNNEFDYSLLNGIKFESKAYIYIHFIIETNGEVKYTLISGIPKHSKILKEIARVFQKLQYNGAAKVRGENIRFNVNLRKKIQKFLKSQK